MMNYNFTKTQKNKIIEKWGQDFYTQIQNNIALYSKKWYLSDFEFVEYYSSCAVFFCKSEPYGDCALKIYGGIREYRALQAYNNSGKYCKVYECDLDNNAVILIERIIPGQMLSEEPSLEKRLSVFSDLFTGLHIEPKNHEPPDELHADWVNGLADYIISNREANKEFYVHALKAKEIYAEMASVYNKKALLHVDLHFHNILSCGNGKYKIIDPFGWIGDPVFEIGHYIYFEYFRADSEQRFKTVDKICDYFEKSLDIPKKISKQCFYIDMTMWNFWHIHDGSDKANIDDVRFAETVLNERDIKIKMEDYTFQLANHNEVPEIVSIYHSLIGTPGCAWDLDYPSKESAEYDINNGWLYTLKKHDKIIAVASAGDFDELGDLTWKPKNPCELMRIGVSPTFQKQGIGTIILQNIIRTAKEKGYDGIRMLVSKTNPAALALYNKNGFEQCGEVFRFDIDFYCYQIIF